MEDYESLYKNLLDEFENYQRFTEGHFQELHEKNTMLEKRLAILSNIVEVSKYINSYISDDNLIMMINDMIVGILGVNYSTVHLMEEGKLVVKASNIGTLEDAEVHYNLTQLTEEDTFMINSQESIFYDDKERNDVHSLIGVPIRIKGKFTGFIVVEHRFYRFFETTDIKFVETISHQIAIAIENSILYKKVEEASKKDVLLNIYNRKFFYDFVFKFIEENPGGKFGLAMVDIDDFKKVNDTYGHQFGDRALKHITEILQSCLNKKDIIARYGGEEIIIFLADEVNGEDVLCRVECMRDKVEKSLLYCEGKPVKITLSLGLSFYSEKGQTLEKILKIADDNLYKAKSQGKNKVIS